MLKVFVDRYFQGVYPSDWFEKSYIDSVTSLAENYGDLFNEYLLDFHNKLNYNGKSIVK